jgi:hypothetical protein
VQRSFLRQHEAGWAHGECRGQNNDRWLDHRYPFFNSSPSRV